MGLQANSTCLKLWGQALPCSIGSASDLRSSFSQASIFREVAAEVGLKFFHFNGATGEFYMPETMGAGVALLDRERVRSPLFLLSSLYLSGSGCGSGAEIFPFQWGYRRILHA